MKNPSILFLFSFISNFAFAHPFEGRWEKFGIECSSGTSPKSLNDFLITTERTVLQFSRYKLKLTSKINFRYNLDYANKRMTEIQNEIRILKSSGTEEQKKSIRNLEQILKETQLYANGYDCKSSTISIYSFDESTINTQVGTYASSCPGDNPLDQLFNQTSYRVDGDQLRLTHTKAESNGNRCPNGDNIITVFRRIR